jgi:hypothetical protein
MPNDLGPSTARCQGDPQKKIGNKFVTGNDNRRWASTEHWETGPKPDDRFRKRPVDVNGIFFVDIGNGSEILKLQAGTGAALCHITAPLPHSAAKGKLTTDPRPDRPYHIAILLTPHQHRRHE